MIRTNPQSLISALGITLWLASFSALSQTLPVTRGLKLWLRADAGLTTNSNGVVTAWADQSGLGNHAIPPADLTKAPTVELNALNGSPTLRFGGGTRYLDVTNSISISGLAQDVTILTLVKYEEVSRGHCCAVAKTVANLPAPFDWYNADSDRGRTAFYLGNGSQHFGFMSVASPPVGIYNVLGFSWRNGIAEQYLNDFNNGHATYAVTPGDGGGPLRIGSRADLVTQLKGNLAEVLIYQPALSEADRTSVIDYLRTKYALAFNRPPTASILTPASGSTVDAQADLPVTINASDPDGTVARVDLLANGASVASWTQPPYTINVSSLNPGTAVLAAVAMDNLGRSATSAPISLTVTGAALYRFDASAVPDRAKPSQMKLGTNRNPKGEEMGINSFHLTRNGKPWLPVMGEFHYSRYPREQWEDSLLRMKAGGIDVVATYVFGILHQEIEGQWDWTGNKDLRHFMQLCVKHGLYVWLRAGPYCHGECRNGGYPDWLLPRLSGPKTADPALKKYARLVYKQVRQQSEGLLFKDGGPVIGFQLDNECGDGTFLMWLKQLAREVGIDVPYYSQTGWARAQVPPNEIIPVFGGYPDAPWTGGTHPLIPANQYTFTGTTADAAYAYEYAKYRQKLDQGFWLPPDVPFATVEMGTGNQIRYPRRPLFTKGDIDAMQYVVIGKGANMLGYYMYHGGSHPVGKLTTMEEQYEYPKISYDFLAALGEYGKSQPWYHSLRVLHLFLQDFGETLAPMFPVLPSRWPASPADSDTLRCIVRVKGDSGFLFFNNYHRGMPMKNLGPLQFQVRLRNEALAFPQSPVVIKADTYAIWPMNQPLGDARLKYATAQPLCRLNGDGGIHYFFKATDGVAPEYVFDSQTITSLECPEAKIARAGKWTTVGDLSAGTECVISLTTTGGQKIRISTLTSDEAEQCYKAKIWGQERVFLSPASLAFDGQYLQLLHCGREKARESTNSMGIKTPDSKVETASFGVFPPVAAGLATGQKPLREFKDGIFDRYPVAVPRQETPVTWEALSDAECRRSENALAGAQWIWSDADNTNTTTAYFRKEFVVPEGAQLKRATLVYSAANYAKLWLNGQLVDEGGSTAMVPPALTVTDRLHPGRNVIATSAANPAGPGGWIAKLVLEFQDGTPQTVATDPTWKSAKAEHAGWFAADLDDAAWNLAVKIGDWGGPWPRVPESWYGPTRKAWRMHLPPQATEGLSDVLLRINYVGDVAFLTDSRSGRLLADNFYSQPLWEVGLRHFSPESLRGGVVLWITPLKTNAPVYMPEESRPKFDGPDVAELKSIVALPEYRIVITSPTPSK